jgi:hypothetical protein
MALVMLAAEAVIEHCICDNDYTAPYQIIKSVEKSIIKGLSISGKIVLEKYSAVKY